MFYMQMELSSLFCGLLFIHQSFDKLPKRYQAEKDLPSFNEDALTIIATKCLDIAKYFGP